MGDEDKTKANYDGHTFDVGHVHVKEYPHGPCTSNCPHPDHQKDKSDDSPTS